MMMMMMMMVVVVVVEVVVVVVVVVTYIAECSGNKCHNTQARLLDQASAFSTSPRHPTVPVEDKVK
jgi:hypothetical protein